MRCITHSLTHTLNNQLIVSLLSSRRRQTQKASHLLSDSNKCSDDILLEKNSHVQVVNERPRTHALLLFLFFPPRYYGNFQMESSSAMWDKVSQRDPSQPLPASPPKRLHTHPTKSSRRTATDDS